MAQIMPYRKIADSTAQHSTAQHSTAQHSTNNVCLETENASVRFWRNEEKPWDVFVF